MGGAAGPGGKIDYDRPQGARTATNESGSYLDIVSARSPVARSGNLFQPSLTLSEHLYKMACELNTIPHITRLGVGCKCSIVETMQEAFS